MRPLFLATCALVAMAPAPALAETAEVNGISLHYTVKGAGEPLLLLHGFGSCAADWGTIAEKLSAAHKVISIDARGHGLSTNPSGKFSHAGAADDIRALMDTLGIVKVQAIGFSSGAMMLLHLATRYPDRVSKMVVVAGTTHFPDEARAILQSASVDTMPPEILAGYQKCASRGVEQIRSLVGQFRAFGFSTDDMNLNATDLEKIKARTLIVHGDRDMFFPVSIPVSLYQSIRRSELWIVPNGDHSPTAGASETAFVSNVETFLAE
jgi:pimeloyl-ACP methyl ester carboxylesterase